MFDKLKRDITVHNTIIFGILVFILCCVIYIVTFFRTTLVINENVNKAFDMVRVSSYPITTVWRSAKKEPNSMVLFVNLNTLNIEYASEEEVYSDAFLQKVVVAVVESNVTAGRYKQDGVYLAYKTEAENDYCKIALYNYTTMQLFLVYLGIVLAVAFIISVFVIFFMFRIYAKREVAPIEEAFIKQRELVANASHELKTPITIISTSLSVMKTVEDEQDKKKWLTTVENQTSRMANLVEDMLQLAKVEQEESPPEKLNLSEILEGIMLSMEVAFFENNHTLNTDIQDSISIFAPRTKMEKLFYTLLENAVKYTPKDGEVWVKLYMEKRKIIFKTRNTGEGISKEKLNKLFDRFYKADESHTSGGEHSSFGLGLAISKSIADSLGGTITAESEMNKYTEFTVTLPQSARMTQSIQKIARFGSK